MIAQTGRWIYRYRYAVVVLWAVLLLVMLPVAPRAQERFLPGGFTNEDYPSAKARELLKERFDINAVTLVFILGHPEWEPFSTEFIDAAEALVDQIEVHPDVLGVNSYLDQPGFVSDDGELALVIADLDLDIEESLVVLDEIVGNLDEGDLEVVVTGAPPLYRDVVIASGEDLRRGELVAFPLAAIALLIVFGTILAAVMPTAVGGVAVAVGLGVVYYVAGWYDISVLAFNIITLLGIGMSIDYSLFYVNRFKEELANGLSVPDAIAETHAHAGLAILFSGITSVIGVASLLLFDLTVLSSIGVGAVVVISIALLSAQTLMPAILGIVGERINRFQLLPWNFSGMMWSKLADSVMQRPFLFLVPSVALLIALAIPFKDIRPGTSDATILPTSYASRQGYDLLQDRFGWEVSTVLTVAYTFDGDPFSEDNLTSLYAFGKALEGLPEVTSVTSIVNLRPTLGLEDYTDLYRHPGAIYDVTAVRLLNDSVRDGVALFYVESDGHPFSPEARALVATIKAFRLPDAHAIHIDGSASSASDLIGSLYGRFPIVIIAVILMTFVSLMILFRSILIPLKAVILNILSIVASFGALVWVFQQGNMSGLLGFESQGIIEATLPIVLFATLFGLSMDYEIFLLSRIREAYRETRSNRESVKLGLQHSGTIITGAGSILIVVGGSFVLADVVTVKSIGFGLALAIFIDVTIVRVLIAPALMRLFGKWNWWMPSALDRVLPRIRID